MTWKLYHSHFFYYTVSSTLEEVINFSLCFLRKIEIVQFASRTRQQFVRLLALVKWASSAERVDKCQVSMPLSIVVSILQ